MRGDLGLLGDDAGGELLGRHFEREEPDDAAIGGFDAAVGARAALPSLGDVEGDVGGERALAHAGASRQDHEVGFLQPAHHAVEVLEAGGEAGQFAVALIGMRRHLDRGGERLGEALEAAIIAAGLGEFVEAALGRLDLVLRARIDRQVVGGIDHLLADLDQRAADREVIDGAAVIGGIDDGGGFGGEAGEILAGRQAGNVDVARQEGLQRDRSRGLADPHEARRDLVDASDGAARRNAAARGNPRPGRTPRCSPGWRRAAPVPARYCAARSDRAAA